MTDVFGRSQGLSRANRIQLLAEMAEALLRGEMPSVQARMFVGGALLAWLSRGGRCGSLERDFLQVTQPERSRVTPAALWKAVRAQKPVGHLKCAIPEAPDVINNDINDEDSE